MNKYIPFALVVAAVLVIGLSGHRVFFSGPEDTWLCENGEWVKHGNPSASMPEGECSGNSDSREVGQNDLHSISCEKLNTQETVGAGIDAEWKERIESTNPIEALIEGYGPAINYETYFGNICDLSDGGQILTYSHYADNLVEGGIIESEYTKGVVYRNPQDGSLYIDTNLPCEIRPPDGTAPALISSVESGIALINCPSYSPQREVKFDLSSRVYTD